MQDEVNICFLW